ncbi:hypothetical protein VTK73DRAFT_4047 [Phialemonium thermophilum]|uniref:Alpha/beta hydrolase fold-3 domain-containing protein n=1 Tax=Phialemonium thermophilum TaxID=223376 RepID=A0ABR3WVD4_9PEZI
MADWKSPKQAAKLLSFCALLLLDLGVHLILDLFRNALGPGRPCPAWTFRQALRIRVTKSLLRWASVLRITSTLSLDAGPEGERFCLVPPAPRQFYLGVMRDPAVRPHTIGGTWTPAPPHGCARAGRRDDEMRVVLHFHGGAYVMGNGRDEDTGFLAETYLSQAGFTHVFTPQYRLATSPDGRFPAALQDALSAYWHLVAGLGIPPQRIVVAGDSAGGNVVVALLRYLFEYGEKTQLPWPAAVLLWSPWTSIAASNRAADIRASPNYATDYIHENFPLWGVQGLTGGGVISAHDPYLSPGDGNGFNSASPIWVHTGRLEVLFENNADFVDTFRRAGTSVEWDVDANCPHDVGLMGRKLKFEKEALAAAARAGRFAARHFR